MRRIYVAGTYTHAATVRVIHDLIAASGAEHCSTWAELASGPEDLRALDMETKRAARDENYRNLASAHVVLIYDPDYDGHETYMEVARAIDARKPIVHFGPRMPLSLDTYDRVFRATSIVDAVGLATDPSIVPNAFGL